MGIIILILRRLPEAAALQEAERQLASAPEAELTRKGLPILSISKGKAFLSFWLKRLWHFILEAKDLKHSAPVTYRIKKIFSKRAKVTHATIDRESVAETAEKDEAYYLERIKEEPKELDNYGALGQFYIQQGNFSDAQNVFEYLIKHDAGNSNHYAKLGYCKTHLGMYEDAVANYEKALALDSSHPNRYYNLGFALKALNRFEESANALKKAIELEPTNSKYQQLYEEALEQESVTSNKYKV